MINNVTLARCPAKSYDLSQLTQECDEKVTAEAAREQNGVVRNPWHFTDDCAICEQF